METQQPTTTNREAYERFLKGVKRMVAEKEEERKTAVERYQNDPHLQQTIAELRQLNGTKESTAN
ncbi:hypothetical protein EXU85_17860 [Spirosoma sp. KCTC 42546]|uniref:hypothetical protein n=1 Tax=Spirosoma sp. KCTC 42546 TaxID=2520506 RepID=UPI001158C16F|nr:hypothetical protein [Spirosoma sp. KCTC 42546]QDK80366.1 hypothetical protein EXU85_17860 [Spirosoma sp. KCTC 42546]